MHWYVDKYPESEKNAIAEFKRRYSNVPYQNRTGAKDEYSTYVHLIVCYLEYRSMATLIGEEKAKQLMWNQNHYTWIYNNIVDDAALVGKVLKESGLDLVESLIVELTIVLFPKKKLNNINYENNKHHNFSSLSLHNM